MRPRILLRTAEFLWQEGHTAHETYEDAMAETLRIHEIYRQFVEEVLAIPVIPGEKPPNERFPGADNSFTIEAMMQDGRALQAGTSHCLGQNFAKSIGIQFQSREGALEYAYTTSWGVSTRLLGALVMTHGDDDGMRMPPRVAPWQIVIAPILRDEADGAKVMAYCESLKAELNLQQLAGQPLRVKIDARDIAGAEKKWEWIKKGAPLLLELGPRDVESGKVCVMRRDQMARGKRFLERSAFVQTVANELAAVQTDLFDQAMAYQRARLALEITSRAEFENYFGKESDNTFASNQGFVRAKWSGDPASFKILDNLGVTVRCIPLNQDGGTGDCVLTGAPATQDAIFARAY
jgi:prolyl-tRNA synthetase